MSFYTFPGDQVWVQPHIAPTQTAKMGGSSVSNQYDLPGPRDDLGEQEDLVERFARQMNMSTPPGISSQAPLPIIYSITQHYHHSSHVACRETDSAPKAHVTVPPDATSLEVILMKNNIDPLSLTPMQRQLFEYAMPDQRSRLLQMWQICPASSLSITEGMEGGKAQSMDTRVSQTMPNQTAQLSHLHDVEMCDQSLYDTNESQHYAEPYMVAGYEDSAQKDCGLPTQTFMSLTVEPTTGAPYKVANDPIYGIRASAVA